MCVCKRENVLDTRRRLAIIDGFGMRVKVLQNKIKNLFIKFFSLSLSLSLSFLSLVSLSFCHLVFLPTMSVYLSLYNYSPFLDLVYPTLSECFPLHG